MLDGDDRFADWLAGILGDGGMPSPDTALEMADAAMSAAERTEGDDWLRRYYVLSAGQALTLATSARLHERLGRIEEACPGLGEKGG